MYNNNYTLLGNVTHTCVIAHKNVKNSLKVLKSGAKSETTVTLCCSCTYD